jgi:hypothetical protein
MGEEISEVGFVLGHEQKLRRSADPKPCQFGERLIGQSAAAQLRHQIFEQRREIGKRHYRASSAASSAGRA